MKEKWFQLPLSGYVQRVGFYAFLIHSSTLSEVVFCTTSAYLSPCTRVYVRGLSPSGRIFQIPTVWSNMITQIPKWYLWYLSDMSWWLFHVGMPYSMWCVLPRIRSAFCHHLWWCGKRSEWLSVTAYISEELFLANHDIQWDIFPPIYHGLWHSPPQMKLSAVKLRGKKPYR